MQRPFSALMLILAFALAACGPASAGEASTGPAGYHTMDVQELHRQLASKDFIFVNVHIPFEGDIANTDLSIPFDEITQPQNLKLLPADKDAKIVLYCRSGRMSAIAAKDLAGLGYTNVWDVPGGFNEWKAAGFPLE
jgi:rhodanese-related sulfurtransferase